MFDGLITVLMSLLYYFAVAVTSLAVGIYIGRQSKVRKIVEALDELRRQSESEADNP